LLMASPVPAKQLNFGLKCSFSSRSEIRAQCYITFHGRNSKMFVIS
jgi:hypothetical protein